MIVIRFRLFGTEKKKNKKTGCYKFCAGGKSDFYCQLIAKLDDLIFITNNLKINNDIACLN